MHPTADHVRPTATDFPVDGLLFLSALEQARLVAAGDVKSVDLVERYLSRIVALNPSVGAFVDVFADDAIRQASWADRARKKGQLASRFHGVPTAVKDQHMVKFRRTRLGSQAFNFLWSPIDDPVVKRLRAAGFVILGKTAMSELGLLPVIEPEVGSPTRNPWDLTRTAGGSSGGAGAAVSAGFVPIAPGSDGAGSVRIPACLNGLYGHKPTRNLVYDGNQRIDVFGLTAIGPLARDLDDAAALLDVLAQSGDAHLLASRRPLEKLTIGAIESPPFGEVDERILAKFRAIVRQLGDAGHRVEARGRPNGTLEEFTPIYQRLISRIPVVQPKRLQPTTRWFVEKGKKITNREAKSRLVEMERNCNAVMDGVDVVLTLTIGIIAPKIGVFADVDPAEHFRKSAILGAFTALANITGMPSLSVPMGMVDGLPVGLQIVGKKGDDARLFQLARVIAEVA